MWKNRWVCIDGTLGLRVATERQFVIVLVISNEPFGSIAPCSGIVREGEAVPPSVVEDIGIVHITVEEELIVRSCKGSGLYYAPYILAGMYDLNDLLPFTLCQLIVKG